MQVVEACRYVASHQARVASGELPVSQQIAPITNIVFMVSHRATIDLYAINDLTVIQCLPTFSHLSTRHIVAYTLQGMGEPLHNLEAVQRSISILCHTQGLQFSHNRVTVSTVGLIPEVQALVASSSAQLAVSLHATTDEVRDWIAPVNRRYVTHVPQACDLEV